MFQAQVDYLVDNWIKPSQSPWDSPTSAVNGLVPLSMHSAPGVPEFQPPGFTTPSLPHVHSTSIHDTDFGTFAYTMHTKHDTR